MNQTTSINLENSGIAVIGLGYVGLPLAVEFGKIRTVIGFDIKAQRIAELRTGRDHTLEVSEEELRKARYLTLTDDIETLRFARGGAAMIFIVTVPTPVDKSNRPDLTPLTQASETVGRLLKAGDVVIYESTVYPGATEEICVPVLERESGLSLNLDFYCGYSPERINPGDKTHRITQVIKITSGSTPEAAEAIDGLYREIIVAGTYKASSIKVAEAAKVIENTQRDINIAFVNELSIIFDRLGIDTEEILQAASTKWNFLPFRPGLVGGHCIGVDPYYLTHKAQALGYQPEIILAGRRINDNISRYVAHKTIRLMLHNKIDISSAKVGVLGLTFKENCPDIRNSKVLDIIHELRDWGLKVRVIDPWASNEQAREEFGLELESFSPTDQVDSLVVAVAHSEFIRLSPEELRSLCFADTPPVIIDIKSIFNRKSLEAVGFRVFRL
jgi:UDP-N-acetyl-D-galactosamine dehydrogenase